MAELDSAQQSAGVAPATAATSDAHMTQGRMSEVENALSVLQREAGLTEDTLKVLRKAVSDNLQPRSAGESNEDETGSRKRPFKPSSSKRQQLTADEAAEIYKLRPLPGKGGSLRRGSMLHCKAVAPKYGVTPKTIRDVWSGRSWAEATRPLWTEEEIKRRSANEEESKHSLERSGMPPHGIHPDDPSRMAVSYPYMPMGSCGMVGGAMINWSGAAGANGSFQPPGYMPSVALANMAGLGILSAGHMSGMANGFNFMGPGGSGQMDGSSMAGSQHGGLANPMGGHAMHHGMMPPGAMPMHVNVCGVTGMGGPGGMGLGGMSGRTSDGEEVRAENPMLGTAGQMGTGGWMGQDVKAVPRTE